MKYLILISISFILLSCSKQECVCKRSGGGGSFGIWGGGGSSSTVNESIPKGQSCEEYGKQETKYIYCVDDD